MRPGPYRQQGLCWTSDRWLLRRGSHWRHLLRRFEPCEKLGKRLRKTTDVAEYKAITREIFHCVPLKDALDPDW